MIRIKETKQLIVVLFMMVYFIAKVYANDTISEIIKIEEKIQNLDKKIVELMRFKMVKQPRDTSKLILKDNNNELWLFKAYTSSAPAQNSIATSWLARLLGVGTPTIYEINLPINSELLYGSVQKFILNAKSFNLSPVQLSKEQIKNFQQHQILDYLVCNPDSSKDQFFLDLKTKEIIGIDKDSSLIYMQDMPAFDDSWENSYYNEFWNAHVKEEITLNLVDSLQLIKYIQSFNDKTIRKLLAPLFVRREEILEQIIVRKNNLKINFKIFYQNLQIKEKEDFQNLISKIDNKRCLKMVEEKIKKNLLEKQLRFKQLKIKKIEKQRNLKAVFWSQAWELIEELYDATRENLHSEIKEVLLELQQLRKKTSSICQKFTLSLYMKQMEMLLQEYPLRGFFEQEIKSIIRAPQNIDLFNIEYNCRSSYALSRKTFIEYKDEIERNPENILAHLNYIRGPLSEKENEEILNEYNQKIKKHKNNAAYRLLYGIISNDCTYFDEINQNFPWKYLGEALIFIDEEEKIQAIQSCEKTIKLNKGKDSVYWGYMIKGLLFEHNDQWIRFGKGFNIDKAITSFKKALRIKPDSVRARLNIGSLYLIKKFPRKALKEFRKIEKINVHYARENFHFGKIKQRSWYKNEREYLEVVRMNTLSGKHHYLLGLGYAVKNNYKKAEEHFIKAEEFGCEIDIDMGSN